MVCPKIAFIVTMLYILLYYSVYNVHRGIPIYFDYQLNKTSLKYVKTLLK